MKNNKTYLEISRMEDTEVFKLYNTNIKGLDNEYAEELLEENGKNIPSEQKEKTILYFIIESFKDKFILILFLLALVNFVTGDRIGSIIIIGISIVSACIRFIQDYSTYRFNIKLKNSIRIFTDVIRNNKQIELRQEDVVLGDIITFSAGSVVPADLYLIDSKDLFINQSSFTGESEPIEKIAMINETITDPMEMPNICLIWIASAPSIE